MIKVLELFAGIGACSKALERLGIEHEIVDAVEIDKYAIKSFNAIHNTNFGPQDITKWNKDIEVDLIMHGSPCQDISLAGLQKGADEGSGTRSSLMYETIRIVKKLKPKYVIWENVKNILSKKHRHNFDNYLSIMESLGYKNYYKVLNAKDFGIPQNRERVFTVSILNNKNFKFPEKQELKLRLKDMLEDEVDEKYYLKDYQIQNILKSNYISNKRKIQEKEYCDILCARDWKDPKCVRIGGIFDKEEKKHQTGSIYDKNGISPALSTMQGGWRQPCIEIKNATKRGYQEATIGGSINLSYPDSKIRRGGVRKQVSQTLQCNDSMGVIADKTRKDIKELDRYCEFCGKKLERKRFNGRLEDFTVFSNRKYCNRECMQKDYLKIGKHNQSYSNAHTTARKINELILHKEVCELCGSDNNLDIHHIDGDWQNNNLDNLMCLCRSCHTKYERNKNKLKLRIRKLTPREVWRLMGFDDEDFEKAANIPTSNTQLYKQAGNSIVVNVLEEILKNLLEV